MVVEHDLSKLASVHLAVVVEFEPDLLGLSVNLRELNLKPVSSVEFKWPGCNLVPAQRNEMPDENLDVGGRLSGVVTGALEANTLEDKFVSELDFDPGAIVVLRLPLVPWLFAWAQKVLWFAIWAKTDAVVLSSNPSKVVKMVLRHDSSSHHSSSCDSSGNRGRLDDNGLWLDHHRWLRVRVGLDNDSWLGLSDDLCGNDTGWQDSFTVMIEDDLTELATHNVVLVVELKPNFSGLSMNHWEFNNGPWLQSELEVPDGDFNPATLQKVPYEDLDVIGVLAWVVTRALEANALEDKLIRELNFDPRSVVVFCLPLVPKLLPWAQKVLRLSIRAKTNAVVLSSHLGNCV